LPEEDLGGHVVKELELVIGSEETGDIRCLEMFDENKS
jgi:hypothetical protein